MDKADWTFLIVAGGCLFYLSASVMDEVEDHRYRIEALEALHSEEIPE